MARIVRTEICMKGMYACNFVEKSYTYEYQIYDDHGGRLPYGVGGNGRR